MTFKIDDNFDPEAQLSESDEIDYSELDDFELLMIMASDPEAAKEFVRRHKEEIDRGGTETP